MAWYDSLYKRARTPLLPKRTSSSAKEGSWTRAGQNAYDLLQSISDPVTATLLALPGSKLARGVTKVAKAGKYLKGTPGVEDIERALYFSTLSSPQTGGRAGLGALSGALVGATKQAAKGQYRDAATIVKELSPFRKQFWERAKEGYIRPSRTPRGQATGSSPYNPIDAPSRLLGSMDEIATQAMKSGKIPIEEAQRLTLAGTPESNLGKRVLSIIEDYPAFKIAVPFGRVGIHALEQSLGTRKRRIASGLIGGASYGLGDYVPPEYTPYIAAAGGPFTLPVAAGLAARQAKEAGKERWGAVGEELGRNLPLPLVVGVNPLRPYEIDQLSKMFTPNILRDIAKAEDIHEREAKGIDFGGTMQKIPGLRPQLPVKPRKRDIYGKSISGREESAVKRFFTSEPYRADPTPNTPAVKEMERLGIEVSPPRISREIRVRGQKIPVSPQVSEQMQIDERAGLEPILNRVYANPKFQALDDAQKEAVLREIITRTLRSGRQRAKVKGLRSELESRRKQ